MEDRIEGSTGPSGETEQHKVESSAPGSSIEDSGNLPAIDEQLKNLKDAAKVLLSAMLVPEKVFRGEEAITNIARLMLSVGEHLETAVLVNGISPSLQALHGMNEKDHRDATNRIIETIGALCDESRAINVEGIAPDEVAHTVLSIYSDVAYRIHPHDIEEVERVKAATVKIAQGLGDALSSPRFVKNLLLDTLETLNATFTPLGGRIRHDADPVKRYEAIAALMEKVYLDEKAARDAGYNLLSAIGSTLRWIKFEKISDYMGSPDLHSFDTEPIQRVQKYLLEKAWPKLIESSGGVEAATKLVKAGLSKRDISWLLQMGFKVLES